MCIHIYRRTILSVFLDYYREMLCCSLVAFICVVLLCHNFFEKILLCLLSAHKERHSIYILILYTVVF